MEERIAIVSEAKCHVKNRRDRRQLRCGSRRTRDFGGPTYRLHPREARNGASFLDATPYEQESL
jgi:hypothetical protein